MPRLQDNLLCSQHTLPVRPPPAYLTNPTTGTLCNSVAPMSPGLTEDDLVSCLSHYTFGKDTNGGWPVRHFDI